MGDRRRRRRRGEKTHNRHRRRRTLEIQEERLENRGQLKLLARKLSKEAELIAAPPQPRISFPERHSSHMTQSTCQDGTCCYHHS